MIRFKHPKRPDCKRSVTLAARFKSLTDRIWSEQMATPAKRAHHLSLADGAQVAIMKPGTTVSRDTMRGFSWILELAPNANMRLLPPPQSYGGWCVDWLCMSVASGRCDLRLIGPSDRGNALPQIAVAIDGIFRQDVRISFGEQGETLQARLLLPGIRVRRLRLCGTADVGITLLIDQD